MRNQEGGLKIFLRKSLKAFKMLINKVVFSLRILVRGDFASNLFAILAEQGAFLEEKRKARVHLFNPFY